MNKLSALLRTIASCAACAAALAITQARAADSPAVATEPNSSEVVRMSQFEVTTSQGHGYVATNASEAFKTNSSLMDIPQIDTVVTNDLITDIGYENMGDVLQYFGVTSGYESDGARLPGGGQLYNDEFPVHAGWTDTNTVDSVEIIRGGCEGLYMLNSGLGGIVMKSMKKPIPKGDTFAKVGRFWASVDQWGLWQVGLDVTGPIGKIGDVSLGYRLITDYQSGKMWLNDVKDNRKELYPYFEAIYKNTQVRFHYDIEKALGAQFGSEPVSPTGHVYLGAGRHSAYVPPGNENTLNTNIWEATILQRFSDTWEMRLSGQYFYQIYSGAQVLDNQYIWGLAPDPWILYTNRHNFQGWKYWTAISDISGRYDIGPPSWEMHQSDIFGWAFTDQVTYKYIFSNTIVPFSDQAQGHTLLPGQPAATYAIAGNNPIGMHNLYIPPLGSYYQPASGAGSHTTVWNGGFYWQHTAELVPNWFSVTVGESWISVITDNVTNISLTPWQATELHSSQYVHRLAASLYPFGNKKFMIYALDATNFSPGTSVTYLASGATAPPQEGLDRELGAKALLLGGKLSADFRWEQQKMSNITVAAGIFPNGSNYFNLAGFGKEEGVDGDLAWTIASGWQVVGSFYSGHNRDQLNRPVSGSWDNSLGFFTRYDFSPHSPLHGLSIGGGYSKVGGRWVSTNGIINGSAYYTQYTRDTGEIKVDPTDMMNLFFTYRIGKHVQIGVNVANALNTAFPMAIQQITITDLSAPRTFRFQGELKF